MRNVGYNLAYYSYYYALNLDKSKEYENSKFWFNFSKEKSEEGIEIISSYSNDVRSQSDYQLLKSKLNNILNGAKLQLASFSITIFIDVPDPKKGPFSDRIELDGWAVDFESDLDTGIKNVEVNHKYNDIEESLGFANYGLIRPGVAEKYGSQYLNSGFRLNIDISVWDNGIHNINVYAINNDGFSLSKEITIEVQN